MKNKQDKDKATPQELMNEGLGNQEKFQSNTYRKLKGDIKDDQVESIEKAEKDDLSEKSG